MHRSLFCSLTTGLVLLLADLASAHGGEYRGPGDVVPPDTRGTGHARPAGRTGGPNGPLSPGGAIPTTGGANGPTSGGASPFPSGNGVTTPRGAQLTADLSQWQFWWEFNKDAYLDLKAAVHAGGPVSGSPDVYLGIGSREGTDTLRPSDADITGRVLPSLQALLGATDNRDIVSSVLIALGKIGRDAEGLDILATMRGHLRSRDQEIRETAALAMGITQMPQAVDDLVALFADTGVGRQLCERAEVDDRTRAFAGYALGLIGHATADVDVKRRCFAPLRQELTGAVGSSRNVAVAAVNAIRLLRPGTANAKSSALRRECLDTLWSYYRQPLGRGHEQIQAHVPPAIAQLLGRGGDVEGTFKAAFLAELGDGDRGNEIRQSAAIGLGLLCRPAEDCKDDARYSEGLLRYYREGRDQQARYFALMALGKIGGNGNRNELLKVLARGQKALEKPWAALALGVLAHDALAAAGAAGRPDTEIGRALLGQLADTRSPATQGALAIGLGLAHYVEGADDLRRLLAGNTHRDELAGYLCIGLALMDDQRAIEPIRSLVQRSVRRPELLRQAAVALGRLGDKHAAELLRQLLVDGGSQTVAKLSAVASALGFIGDRDSIAPLIETMRDPSLTELSRAFAAAALGSVADKEPLPWNAKIGADLNYRAAVETLVNGSSGVLEIL